MPDLEFTVRANTAEGKAVLEAFKAEWSNVAKAGEQASDKTRTAADKMSASLKNVGDQLQQVGRGMVDFGKSASLYVTAPIVGAAAAVVKFGGDFDKAMSNSLAIMGDVSREMRTKMEEAAKSVARATTFSATQAAEAYFFLASAGLDAAQSIEALPRVAKFAQAGNFDLALATDLLTDAQSALGLTIRDDVVKNMENMNRVSDVLVKANTLANATVQQFSESLTNRAGAALRLVNKDVEEGVAVLAAWADQGVKGAEAGTRLDIVLRDLQRVSINNREEFDKLNISIFDGEGKLRNLADIIEEMEGAFEGMSDETLRATLMQLGFQDRSIAATASLLGMSGEIKRYEALLRQAGGTTEEVANKQLEAFNNKVKLLWGRVEVLAIDIFQRTLLPILEDKVIPAFDSAVAVLERVVEWFTKLPQPVQATTVAVLAAVAAIGPFAIVLGQIVKLTGSSITALGGLVGWLGKYTVGAKAATVATTGLSTAKIGLLAVGGKIAIVIATVTAAALGTHDAYKRLESGTATLSDVTGKNKEGWELLWHTLKKGLAGPIAGVIDSFALMGSSMEGLREEGALGLLKPFKAELQRDTRFILDTWDSWEKRYNDFIEETLALSLKLSRWWREFTDWMKGLSWNDVRQLWNELINSMQNKAHDFWVWITNIDWTSWIPTADDFVEFLTGTEEAASNLKKLEEQSLQTLQAQESYRRELDGVNEALEKSFDRVEGILPAWEALTAQYEAQEITADHLLLKQNELLDSLHTVEEGTNKAARGVKNLDDDLQNLIKSVEAALDPAGTLEKEISKLLGRFSEHDLVKVFSGKIIEARDKQIELGNAVPPVIERLYGLAKAFEATAEAAKRGKEIDAYIASVKAADAAVKELTDNGLAELNNTIIGGTLPALRDLPPAFKAADTETWLLGKTTEDTARKLGEAKRQYEAAGGATKDYSDILKVVENRKHELIATSGALERAIKAMREEGYTAQQIMAVLGSDVNDTARAAKEMGIQLGPMTSQLAKASEATEKSSEAAKAWQDVWSRAMGDVFSRFVKFTGEMLDTGNKFTNALLEVFITNLFSPLFSWLNKITKGFADWLGGLVGLGPKKGFLESLGFGGGTGAPGLGVGKDGISIAGIKIPIPGLGTGGASGFAGQGMTAAEFGLQTATGGAGAAGGAAAQGGFFGAGGLGQVLSAGMLGGGIGSFFGQEGAMIGSMAGAAMVKLMPAFLTGPWGMAIGGGLMAINALIPWLKDKFAKPPEEKALNELSRDFAGLSASQSDLNYFIQHSMGLSLDAVKDIRKETTTLFSLLQGLGPGATQGNQQALISALGQFGVSEAVGRGALARGFEGAFTRDSKGNYIFDLSQAARDAIERGAVDQLRIQLTQILGASDAFRQLVPGFETLIAEITGLAHKAGATASATEEVEKSSEALSDESRKRARDLAELRDVIDRLKDSGGFAAGTIGMLGKGGGEATEAVRDLVRILRDSDNTMRDVLILRMEEMGIGVEDARTALEQLAGKGIGLGRLADRLMDALEEAAKEIGEMGRSASQTKVQSVEEIMAEGHTKAYAELLNRFQSTPNYSLDQFWNIVPPDTSRPGMSESEFAREHPDRVYHDGGLTKAGFGLLDKDELVIPLRSLLSGGGKESKQSTPQVVHLNVDVNVSAPITIQGTKSDELKGAVRDDVVPEFLHMLRLNLRGVAKEMADSLKDVNKE